ncbi:MAG: G5 domain-containing protein [Clostridia bacterium]|nr:G5 domain-containing protein [Clostridia bacterium]
MFKKLRSEAMETHKKSFRILTAVITVLFVCSVTVTAFAAANSVMTVEVVDGDKRIMVSARSTAPADVVEQAGIDLNANDRLDLSGYSETVGGKIVINRAKVVRIQDDMIVGYYVGYGETLGNILENNDVILNEGDLLDVSATTPIFDGMNVLINRAFGVGIEYDGNAITLSIAGGTVADALETAGITLGEHDIVTPSLDTELDDFTHIEINRVTFGTLVETEEIPFETKRVEDSSLLVGNKEVTRKGVDGEKSVTYNAKYIDGVLVEKTFVSEETVKEPVDKIISVGTKKIDTLSAYKNTTAPISELTLPTDLELDENGIPVKYKTKVSAKATAYTGDPATASGRTPMAGHIAVDPTEYPYGTELYIVSADGSYVYGYCIAADTGGFVEMGNTDVDLYLNNEDMCYNWGNRDIIIYVL